MLEVRLPNFAPELRVESLSQSAVNQILFSPTKRKFRYPLSITHMNVARSAEQERPYHSDSTASRLLSEVKHCQAQYYGGGPRWNPGCCSFATV